LWKGRGRYTLYFLVDFIYFFCDFFPVGIISVYWIAEPFAIKSVNFSNFCGDGSNVMKLRYRG
jgi:hypothetical protein